MNSSGDVLEQLLIYAKVILAYNDRRSECYWNIPCQDHYDLVWFDKVGHGWSLMSTIHIHDQSRWWSELPGRTQLQVHFEIKPELTIREEGLSF